jgi:excisionase family DNA binding protein
MPQITGIPITSMQGYTTAQVAKVIGVSKNTLLKWLYSGVLQEPKHSQVGGVRWRIWSKSDVERARLLKGTLKSGPKPKRKHQRIK